MKGEKFYWIKLRTDFFSDDSPIDFLLGQPNGSEYVCLYLKLCLSTANTKGKLCAEIGEMIIPYNIDKITRDMKHFSVDTVRVAMQLYMKLGLIYTDEDGILVVTNINEMVGSESASQEAVRKRRQRLNKKLQDNKRDKSGTNCPGEYREKSIDSNSKQSIISPEEKYIETKKIKYTTVMNMVKDQIDYEALISDCTNYDYYNFSVEEIDGIVQIMADVLMQETNTIKINKTTMPIDTVRSVYHKLRRKHIIDALESIAKTKKKITNRRSFIITTLYNAYATTDIGTRALVSSNSN